MHKRKVNRNTFNQSIKAPESLSRSREDQDQNESTDRFQLPSLQTKKKTWKDARQNLSTRERNGTPMDIFCSSEIENIATGKVARQWELIENTLYQDGEEVTRATVLEECVQWRTQVPHLRVIGQSPFLSSKIHSDPIGNIVRSRNDHASSECSASSKERNDSSEQDEIFDRLYEYVVSELFPSKGNEIDSFSDDFDHVLQIRTAPIHGNKSSANGRRLRCTEEAIPVENKRSTLEEIHEKYSNSKRSNSDGMGNEKDETTVEDEAVRPRITTGRNKLGTVFKEKIVVSSVPYVLSTKESFSTVKTTPIQFMGRSLQVSAFQGGSTRAVRYLRNSGKISGYQPAWHAPVSPVLCPKNIKLAPLDTSRLASTKNRSLISSSVTLPRNRKPLSPISRPTVAVSAQIIHNGGYARGVCGGSAAPQVDAFQIEGRQITVGQSGNSSAPGIDKKKRRANRK